MKTLLLPIGTLLLLVSTAVAQEVPSVKETKGEVVHIGPKWKKGETVRTKLTMESATEQDDPRGGDKKTTTKMLITMVSSETVKDIDEKNVVTAELAYESMAVKQEDGGVEWDSTKDLENEEHPLTGLYGAMLKHKYSLKYDAAGKLSEVKGFDKMFEEALKAYAENESMAEAIRGSMQSSMSDKAMLRMMAAATFFPGKAVAKGDTWEVKTEVPVPIVSSTLLMTTKYQLTAMEPGKDGTLARITGEGTMSSAEKKEKPAAEEAGTDEPKGLFSMFEYVYENGKQSTEIVFNVDRGLLVKLVMKQTMDMKITTKSDGSVTNCKVANTTSMELLGPKPVEPAKPEADKRVPEPEKPSPPKEGE